MTVYHLMGFVSAFLVFLSVSGVAAQFTLIRKRKKQIVGGELSGETATSVLSLTRFTTNFLAVFVMFFYGITLDDFNYYLVLPRIVVLLFLLGVLCEIMIDRRSIVSKIVFFGGVLIIAFSIFLSFSEHRVDFFHTNIPRFIVLGGNSLFVWGAILQIRKIRKRGKTGALSLRMHQLNAVKDMTSLLFGLAMGFQHGWPVVYSHTMSLLLQSMTIYHFRWVRISDLAKSRRAICN